MISSVVFTHILLSNTPEITCIVCPVDSITGSAWGFEPAHTGFNPRCWIIFFWIFSPPNEMSYSNGGT